MSAQTLPVTTAAIQLRPITSPSPVPQEATPAPEQSLSKRRLTKLQSDFVDYYLRGYNCRQAARLAGYAEGTVEEAHRLLNSPNIREEIDRRQAEMYKLRNLTTDRVIDEAMALAFANVMDYVDVSDDGKQFTVNLKNLDRYQAAAIQELTYDAEGRPKIRLTDKKAALELVARLKRMLTDKGDTPPGFNEGSSLTINHLDQIIKQTINVTQVVHQTQARQELPKASVIEATQ